MRLRIGFDKSNALRVAAGGLQIGKGLAVHGEEAAGCAIFGGHVGDGSGILKAEVVEAGAVEFHELADHALLAQHLGDAQHKVGRGDAFIQLAGQLEADDFRNQHGNRLAEHGRFRLDAADAPAQNGKAIDHGGVGISAHQRVRIGDGFAVFFLDPDRLGQIFEVHLMADAGAGGTARKLSKADWPQRRNS